MRGIIKNMVTIRLARAGTKKRPFYHVVAADSKRARDGKFIERLGFFDPLLPTSAAVRLKTDRIQYWVTNGAQLSERVQKLIQTAS